MMSAQLNWAVLRHLLPRSFPRLHYRARWHPVVTGTHSYVTTHTNLYHKINWKYSLIFICELWYYLGVSQPFRGTYLRGRLGLTQNLLAFDIIRHPNKIQIQGVPKVVLHHYRVYLNPPITSRPVMETVRKNTFYIQIYRLKLQNLSTCPLVSGL